MDEVFLVLSRKLFQRLLLGLRNQQRGEDAREHEQGEDLEDVRDESILAALVLRRQNDSDRLRRETTTRTD